MKLRFHTALLAGLLSAAIGLPARAKVEIPPAVSRPVDFQKDVVPILQSSCVNCHSSGKTEADLSIETREKLLEGGGTSPAIVPGNSADSLLIQLVSGMDPEPDRFMPQKGKHLTAEQIGILRAWIDQGANWPDKFVLSDPNKPTPAKLEPRNVKIPAAHDGLTNPIDLLLEPYFAEHKITPGKVVDDRVFARRVYLDIIGLLPPPDEMEQFVQDTSADKRTALVHRLLSDNYRYATHWMSFWNDMLRNDYKGTGYIDGGREQITRWLYDALANNMPYDQFVRELVTGANGSQGFTKGIVWRGVVNAAQTPQMQAAQNIGQVFMGVNLKCASCHDSFISQWKLTDSYGLASVYADKSLEMERCTKPLGKTAVMKFLYPELGEIDANAPKEKRIEQLAKVIANEKNGRLTRTIVNRLWRRLIGRGFIEPVDEMDNKPWNADVLDALAWDLSKQKYDVKKTIETIVLSRAYQLPAVPAADEARKDYVFAGPCVKRMSAEQFVDAVATLSGVWPAKQEAKLTDAAEQYAKAKWIWSEKESNKTATSAGPIHLRKTFELQMDVAAAPAVMAVDNDFKLWVNGKEVLKGNDWNKPSSIDLKPYLVRGKNVLAVVAENTKSDEKNPAGFWFHVTILSEKKGVKPVEINSNSTWKWSKDAPTEWTAAVFDDAKWKKAEVAGDVSVEPWNLAKVLPDNTAAERPSDVRAALCAADPLMIALGRPNREQVSTVRADSATTLTALELTNGTTLTNVLERGAKKMALEKDIRAEALIGRVYATALGRPPTPAEVATAKEAVGADVKEDGVEDFLWTVVMLPEFQLIR